MNNGMIIHSLYPCRVNSPYNWDSFTPLRLAVTPSVLTVNADSPYKTPRAIDAIEGSFQV